MFCRVRPLLPTDPGYLIDDIGRESSVSTRGSGSTKNSGQSALSVVYPDARTDQKKLAVQYSSSEKVCSV